MPRHPPGGRSARWAMYGSVLSGELGGHIYGAGGRKGGPWGGEVEAASEDPIWVGLLGEKGHELT